MAPKLPFKPLWSGWPARKRNLLFGPFALGIFVVVFLTLGFATQDVFWPLVAALPAAVAGAWALVGWPEVRRKDGRPLVEPRVRPYLFFPSLLVLFVVLYPFWGVVLTKVAVPPQYGAQLAIALALLTAIGASYLLFGFPNLWRGAREAYARIPPERRPFLFFPVFAAVFLLLYLGLGVGTTQAMGRLQGRTVLLLNIQVLLLLPVSILVAALVAYLLVGFPRPQKPLREVVPKVTGRHRPKAFLVTFLLAGAPLTVVVGALLSWAAGRQDSAAFLPGEVVLPLALLLGYCLSLGVAALAWGTPRRWRRFDDYTPGLSPRGRLGAAGAAALAVLLAVVIGAGLAGVDIFWGLLVGLILGGAVALLITGAHRRIASRRGAPTLMPDLPERAKSLVLFTSWLVIALVVFSVMTYALPDLIAWNALLALALGLGISLVVVEQGLIKDALRDRREERARRKAWEQRRKEALARGAAAPADEPPHDG
ncbi:MAG TPA: hypothetical protein VNX21_00735 [Candidatus Thermoplasmatota archaeon]|nr:hypothetical protein [Candidatus Thermoplasmatota archaeon]